MWVTVTFHTHTVKHYTQFQSSTQSWLYFSFSLLRGGIVTSASPDGSQRKNPLSTPKLTNTDDAMYCLYKLPRLFLGAITVTMLWEDEWLRMCISRREGT